MNLLSIAGWAYLILGFASGIGLLMGTWGSMLAGGGMPSDWSSLFWSVAIFGLSLFGWALLRNFRTIERRVGGLFRDRRYS